MQDLVAPNIAAWLAVLAFVVGLLNQGGKLVDRFRSSVKEEPAPAQTYVTKAICDQIRGDHIARNSRVEIELSPMRSQRDNDMQELSSQLRALAASHGSLPNAFAVVRSDVVVVPVVVVDEVEDRDLTPGDARRQRMLGGAGRKFSGLVDPLELVKTVEAVELEGHAFAARGFA